MSTADVARPPASAAALVALSRTLGIAHPAIRLRTLFVLAGRRGPLNVGELCDGLDMEQSSMSHNLKLMTLAGLIAPTRRGRNVDYSLTARGAFLHAALASFLATEEDAT